MTGSLLFVAIILLAGAIICVSIAKRLGLSSVLGYLIAGVVIGPYMLGIIGEEGQDIMHIAEFGVVIMLFLIGLEIEPKNFWNMRKTILGMGGVQVSVTMLLSYFLFTSFDYEPKVALVLSMAVALSSTAIVLQTIKEKGLMNTTSGASAFSILTPLIKLDITPFANNIKSEGLVPLFLPFDPETVLPYPIAIESVSFA